MGTLSAFMTILLSRVLVQEAKIKISNLFHRENTGEVINFRALTIDEHPITLLFSCALTKDKNPENSQRQFMQDNWALL